MKKLTSIALVALLIWCGALSVFTYSNYKAAIEAKQIEDVRQGVSNITDLSFRIPLLMKLAADDVLGPEDRIATIKTRSSSSGFDRLGSNRTVGYVFELPETAPKNAIDEILGQFEYYAAIMTGLNASDQWPLEIVSGGSKLTIKLPEPDRAERKIFLDVSMRYSPFVEDSN